MVSVKTVLRDPNGCRYASTALIIFITCVLVFVRVYPSSQFFAQVQNVSTGDEDSLNCNQVLLGDNFDPDYGWDSSKCRLHRYHASDVVECLSQMSSHPKFKGRRMYFAFVGDSRIRIEFHSFWPIFPDYDLFWFGDAVNRLWLSYHKDMEVYSPTLMTRLLFRWRPNIDDFLLYELTAWANGIDTEAPTHLLLGMSSAHMEEIGLINAEYERLLRKMLPILQLLSTKTQIFWLHQNPIIETYGGKKLVGGAIRRSATQEKFDHYNRLVRDIFKGSEVTIWESNHRMAEEYVRACLQMDRADSRSYWNCDDFIHTGYIVVDHGSQYLLNALCNRFLGNSTHPSVNIQQNTCYLA